VTALARAAGLSRSTLLYYDRIGLLCASTRSSAGYRLYSEADERRLTRVVALRATGLPLDAIRQALDEDESVATVLRHQGRQLGAQEQALRTQQQVLRQMLECDLPATAPAHLDRKAWTALFRAIGLGDAEMRQWHAEFERSRPEAHRVFLASLGIPAADIARIRRWARS
jgi:DNA-binding transcriptional MerR regulator